MEQPDKIIYSTSAKVTGGRGGTATIGDRRGTLTLSAPGAGNEEAFNPEQLFAVGYAACFESGVRGLARRRNLPLKSASITAEVSLIGRGIGGYGLKIGLNIDVEGLSDEDARALVREVHEGICPYSNAIRGNVDVGLNVISRA
jgi:osmotically inducible protein OsmC